MTAAVCTLADIPAIRGKVRDFLLAMRQRGLVEYDLYLLWQGGGAVTRDDRAVVEGFSRPTEHCPEKYRFSATDPDIMAKKAATDTIIELCKEIFADTDNIRVMVHLMPGGAVTFSADIPGQGTFE